MPLSRKRRPKHGATRKHHRRPQPRSHEVVETTLADLVNGPTPAWAVAATTRSLRAAARGDVEAALQHELDGMVILESPHRLMLGDLLDPGAPRWAFSRWCLDIAYRTALAEQDPRVDEVVRLLMPALHTEKLERAWDDPTDLLVLGTCVAGGDPLAQDIALFEEGVLADFLERTARPGLLERADHIEEWSAARMGVYRHLETRGCRLVLHDLVSDSRTEALNIGAMIGHCEDHLMGRLVPISDEPSLMFATRPVPVDAVTADQLAGSLRDPKLPLDWLWTLAVALDMGLQEEEFHCRGMATPFTSDLPFDRADIETAAEGSVEVEESPATMELRARGCSAEVAEMIGVLMVGLAAATITDSGAATVAPHVAAALAVPGVVDAAMLECTTPELAAGWDVLAAVVPEHLGATCRALAARARSS